MERCSLGLNMLEMNDCKHFRYNEIKKGSGEKKLHKLYLTEDMVLWEVEGRSRNYIIIEDNFCECTDFQVRVLGREEKSLCYHLLAKIIGEKLELFDSKELTDEEYDKMLESRM